jgi:hypothetical protein
MAITKRQLGRLQTLYAQYARREIGIGLSREERISWACEHLHKQIKSFSDLAPSDAGFLIDSLQEVLGVKAPVKQRPDRAQARRAGLDGRKDGCEFASAPQIASAVDLATLESYYARLGWSRAQFDAWLHSPHSPLKHKSSPTIVTVADANQVRWALKGMLQHAGKWEVRSSKVIRERIAL